MTEQEYNICCSDIATKIWNITTANGRDIEDDLHHDHMQNCYAAAANSYFEGIELSAWQDTALNRLT